MTTPRQSHILTSSPNIPNANTRSKCRGPPRAERECLDATHFNLIITEHAHDLL